MDEEDVCVCYKSGSISGFSGFEMQIIAQLAEHNDALEQIINPTFIIEHLQKNNITNLAFYFPNKINF